MAGSVGTGDAGLLVTAGGWLVAVIVALFTFIAQWRKGGVEETAMVLGKWKELVEAHENQINSLKEEISSLRKRVTELEALHLEKIEKIQKLERELEGERRQSKQREASFRRQLKQLGHNNEGGILDDAPDGK